MDSIKSLFYLYQYLADHKIRKIQNMFPGPAALNSPLSGAVDGDNALRQYMENEGSWLKRHVVSAEEGKVVQNDRRIFMEMVLHMKLNGKKTALPIALVGDKCGKGFGKIRIYHSTWPINGEHTSRPPVVWPGVNGEMPELMERYFRGVTDDPADPEDVISLFTEDGYLQEPSGVEFRHMGPEAVREFVGAALKAGPIRLIPATTTREGPMFALEYICDGWGEQRFDPIAGCAVYEMTDDLTALKAVRIYDDVSPPGE